MCFPGIPPLDSSAAVVGQLRNVGVPWLVGAMAVVYVGVFLLGKALALPAEPFMTKLFADKSIPDVILTLLTIFILAPLNEETLFRGIMLNVFRSRYCWTMWLGALITSLLFVAAHSQYQNLLTLAELFLVGLITSVARIRSGGLLLLRYCCIWKQPRWVYCLVESYIFIKHCALKPGVFF